MMCHLKSNEDGRCKTVPTEASSRAGSSGRYDFTSSISFILKLAAPYIAVAICWCFFQNAWLTILVYHLQILLWSRKQLPQVMRGWSLKSFLLLSLPCIVGGPLVYFLMPYITATPLTEWLARYQLSNTGLLIMIPYFGLVHPLLEQAHWGELRKEGWYAHGAFAGYHAIVLYQLLTPPWLAMCLVVLVGASFIWKKQADATGGLLVPALGHILADLGIVIAAWLMVV